MTAMRSRLTRLLKEPLTHFLLIGAALFLVFRIGDGPKPESPDEIVVTPGVVESLAQSWQKKWQRPPTAGELEGLIESHIREEVLYREALAMGLERDDTIIKRRLGQKMTFLFDDVTDLTDITDEQLLQYLEENSEKYRVDSELEEIREAVVRDLTEQLREENSRKFYDRLRKRYTITVEQPEGADGRAGGSP
jgi:hypothetical protein